MTNFLNRLTLGIFNAIVDEDNNVEPPGSNASGALQTGVGEQSVDNITEAVNTPVNQIQQAEGNRPEAPQVRRGLSQETKEKLKAVAKKAGKVALAAAIVAIVAGGALLLYMHLSGLRISNAGFGKLWQQIVNLNNALHHLTTGQLIYEVIAPTFIGVVAGAIVIKCLSKYFSKESQEKRWIKQAEKYGYEVNVEHKTFKMKEESEERVEGNPDMNRVMPGETQASQEAQRSAARWNKVKKGLMWTGGALLIAGVAVGTLLAYMHFSGLHISKAGFVDLGKRIVTFLNSKYKISTGQIIYEIALPAAVATGVAVLLARYGKQMKEAAARKIHDASERRWFEEANKFGYTDTTLVGQGEVQLI